MSDKVNGDIILGALAATAAYAYLSALFEHRKMRFLHETGVAISLGFLAGLFIYFLFNDYFLRMLDFNDTVVFFVLLPPMLFADGYNLRKRRFFHNVYYINVYGLLGTILNFMTIALLVYAVSEAGFVRDISDFTNTRKLEIWQILLFAACMCSVDPVASLSEIKPESHPKLFSIIFGQSLIKDAITIVLYQSILELVTVSGSKDLFQFQWYTPFQILGKFVLIIIVSISIGVAFSLILTLLFKHGRFILRDKGVTEIALIFLTGYMSYITSQILGYSGVIAMLFCGITMAHFNVYNMSRQGIQAAKVTFESVSLVAEGMLFLLLGIASWQVEGDSEEGFVVGVSLTFVVLALIIVALARFVNVVLTSILFRAIKGKSKWRLNRYEIEILFASGLVKGAVPFALTASAALIDQTAKVTSLIIKSTVTIVVLFTSLLVNGVLPSFIRSRMLLIKTKVPADHPSLFDSLLEKQKRQKQQQDGDLILEKQKVTKHKVETFWKKINEKYLKPFLIYKYAERKEDIQKVKKRQRAEQLRIQLDEENQQEKKQIKENKTKKSFETMYREFDSDDQEDDNQVLDKIEKAKRNKKKMKRQQKKSSQIKKAEFEQYINTNPPAQTKLLQVSLINEQQKLE